VYPFKAYLQWNSRKWVNAQVRFPMKQRGPGRKPETVDLVVFRCLLWRDDWSRSLPQAKPR